MRTRHSTDRHGALAFLIQRLLGLDDAHHEAALDRGEMPEESWKRRVEELVEEARARVPDRKP